MFVLQRQIPIVLRFLLEDKVHSSFFEEIDDMWLSITTVSSVNYLVAHLLLLVWCGCVGVPVNI